MTHRTLRTLRSMLGNLDRWLEEAVSNAGTRGFDAEVLLQARLAPDQFALVRQVQSACDTAKFIASRLTDRAAPSHPDTETSLEELRARIAATLAYLEGFEEAELHAGAQRELYLPFLRGAFVSGQDYLEEFALPNFFFHVTTAYAILRHNGVPLGKRAFIGHMSIQQPKG